MNKSVVLTKKVYIELVYGSCNRRALDTQKISVFFKINGYDIVKSPKHADIIILVTCGVSLSRESTSIRRICNLKKFHGQLIVSGCLPSINPQKLSSVFNGIKVSTSELSKIDDLFPNMKIKFTDLKDANYYIPPYHEILSYKFFQLVYSTLKSFKMLSLRYILYKEFPKLIKKLMNRNVKEDRHYQIRISWGCNRKCSYCRIRNAIGAFHSKPLETCRNELISGLDNGYKNFDIIADDVGAYGIDIEETFPNLLQSLFSIQGKYNVFIHNLAPIWLVKYQAELKTILTKINVRQIHCPIQSGSPKVLEKMIRYSNVDNIKESLRSLKKACNNLIVTTDIIIGYPGETEEDLNKTLELIKYVNFDRVGIFIYHDTPNTISFYFKDKISLRIIKKRVYKTRSVLEKMNIDYGVI